MAGKLVPSPALRTEPCNARIEAGEHVEKLQCYRKGLRVWAHVNIELFQNVTGWEQGHKCVQYSASDTGNWSEQLTQHAQQWVSGGESLPHTLGISGVL